MFYFRCSIQSRCRFSTGCLYGAVTFSWSNIFKSFLKFRKADDLDFCMISKTNKECNGSMSGRQRLPSWHVLRIVRFSSVREQHQRNRQRLCTAMISRTVLSRTSWIHSRQLTMKHRQAAKGEIDWYQVPETECRPRKVVPTSFIMFVNLLIPCQTLARIIIRNVWYDICKFPKVMKLDETTFGGHVRFLELGTRWFRI